jgi:hypothetical protein
MHMEDNFVTADGEQAWPSREAAPTPGQVWAVEGAGAGRLRPPLASLLADEGVASKEQLEAALAEGQESGERLGEVVLRHGWINEAQLASVLARQWDLPYVALSMIQVDGNARSLMDYEESTRLGACPVGFDGGMPLVAIADPNEERLAAVREQLGTDCAFFVTTPTAMAQLTGPASSAPDPVVAQTAAPALVGLPATPILAEVEEKPEPEPHLEQPTPLPGKVEAEAEEPEPGLEQLDHLLERLLEERTRSRKELATSQRQLASLDEDRARLQESIEAMEATLSRDDRLLESMRAKLTELSESFRS